MKIISPPVLFLVFNRLEYTKKSFAQIQKAKPKKLYIASDGPREEVTGENKIVQEVRDYILKNINWKCQIKTLFRGKNLGCKIAVSQAITWFFEHEEMGITLEDDCVPSLSYFSFCNAMLKKYRNNDRIMAITGHNFLKIKNLSGSYFFTKYCITLAAAMWRRSWKKVKFNTDNWDELDDKTYHFSNNYFSQKYHDYTFNLIRKNIQDHWDIYARYAWYYNHGLMIVPKHNLIQNIGVVGIHSYKKEAFHNIEAKELDVDNIIHPNKVYPNQVYDRKIEKSFARDYIFIAIKNVLKKVLPKKIVNFLKKI